MLKILELELENGIFFQLFENLNVLQLYYPMKSHVQPLMLALTKKISNILRLVRMSKTFPVIIVPEK